MARIFIYAKSEVSETLALILSLRGHSPICSEREREALRQIITFRPQLVLTEFLELDGEKLCCEIRKIKQLDTTQVIMMSEIGPHLSEEKFRALVSKFGANGYLLKPFPHREVGDYAHSWLHAS